MAKRKHKAWLASPQTTERIVNLMVLTSPDGEAIAYVDQDTMDAFWIAEPEDCSFCTADVHHYHGSGKLRMCPLCGTDSVEQCWMRSGR